MNRSLLIGGHSHAIALGAPGPANVCSVIPVDFAPHDVFAVWGPWPRDSDYWDFYVNEAAGKTALLSWNGNQHQAYFMIAPSPGFDFILSSQPELDPNPLLPIIPEQMLRELFEPSMTELATLLGRLKLTARSVLLCGTPPPKKDVVWIRNKLTQEPHVVAAAQKLGIDASDIEITPPEIMLKLWCLIQNMLEEYAAAAGVLFIPVPPLALTGDRYLREEFWADDITHANLAYGRLVLEGIREREMQLVEAL